MLAFPFFNKHWPRRSITHVWGWKKLKEVDDLEIQAPTELVENFVGEAYYKVPYTIIISSPK